MSKGLKQELGDVNIIIHMAAESHVDNSISDPRKFFHNNINGTVEMLEYAKNLNNLENFFYFSTDEVFGPAKNGEIFHENSRYNACNPYSATKAAGEELCNSYYNTYNIPIVITHTMNVYGPRQHEEKFIPIIIKISFFIRNP